MGFIKHLVVYKRQGTPSLENEATPLKEKGTYVGTVQSKATKFNLQQTDYALTFSEVAVFKLHKEGQSYSAKVA